MTDSERERLVLLIEECAEVQQAATKALRHGYENWSPFDAEETTNRTQLTDELREVYAIIRLMSANGDVSMREVTFNPQDVIAKKMPYLHHQEAGLA